MTPVIRFDPVARLRSCANSIFCICEKLPAWRSWLSARSLPRPGCGKRPAPAPPPPTIADLKFPVVLIQDGLLVLPRASPDELLRLHSNYLNMNIQVGKTLIDSDFRIYKVLNLRSTRSGLGQMMKPVSITPIAFELSVKGRGLEQTRAAIVACQFLGDTGEDTRRKRAAVARETTLAGMIQAIQPDEPDTQPAPGGDDAAAVGNDAPTAR